MRTMTTTWNHRRKELRVEVPANTKIRVYEGPAKGTLLLRISNLLDVNVPLNCTLLMRVLLVNGNLRVTVEAESILSWDALKENNKHVTTDPTKA